MNSLLRQHDLWPAMTWRLNAQLNLQGWRIKKKCNTRVTGVSYGSSFRKRRKQGVRCAKFPCPFSYSDSTRMYMKHHSGQMHSIFILEQISFEESEWESIPVGLHRPERH